MANLIRSIAGAIYQWQTERDEEKRSIVMQTSSGEEIDFVTFANGKSFISGEGTPLLENIFKRVAAEFGKLDLNYIKAKDGEYEVLDSKSLHEILTLRPNEYMNKYDFLYTLAYQRIKFGNAIAVPIYKMVGNEQQIVELEIIDCDEWLFGNSYKRQDGQLYLHLKNKNNDKRWLLEYSKIIHLRYNPNKVFKADKADVLGRNNMIVKMFDENISTQLKKLSDSGSISAVIELGSSATGTINGTMLNDKDKIKKQKDALERIKASEGIFVTDAGEKFVQLNKTFQTITKEDVDSSVDYLYEFYGVNRKVINGTADEETMEVFYSSVLVPAIEQFMSELNFKLLTKTARSQGHRITHVRNPFEYVSLAKAANSIYKVSHIMTRNQILAFYNLPPVKGGDEVLNNLNFANINDADLKGGDE